MAIKIARDGTESEIRSVMDYLKERHSISPEVVKRLNIEAEAGAPIVVTVSLYVQAEAGDGDRIDWTDPLGLTEDQRLASDARQATARLFPTDMWAGS